ncbi:hypothetical protein [Flavobacterium phage 2A]|nr:hypothetical protein BOX10_gp15 [Flavobacterium phage 2A]YP_009592321.1 hypothetical protein FDG69_gp13 [Flavobacterium phage 23T]QCW20069.1 hypothetical protein [Flavobacterium phage FPSV-D15]QCW20224.1 hypothetical protein [Flavobacterium phage FPSV-F7]QCW20804.1 hypothetical protein [Flavobacterium phage FPSV-D35]ANB40926.1 hypothetical protein [Flavobacterium phage 2A]ANB40985.1 hypothetical protein [Flavobacterium phage 23T]
MHIQILIMQQQPTIKLRDAIKKMRALTGINVPFSFSYISYSEVLNKSEGYKRVNKGLLRAGYRANQSERSNILIAYIDYDKKEADRQFYLPLLMTFNNIQVIP